MRDWLTLWAFLVITTLFYFLVLNKIEILEKEVEIVRLQIAATSFFIIEEKDNSGEQEELKPVTRIG
jgi:hypothetical protein